MPSPKTPVRLSVPPGLRDQLTAFRRQVWWTKMTEAVCLAVLVVLAAFLTVFVADRLGDTPATIRLAIGLVVLVVCLSVPWAMHRWVWQHRRFDQLAELLRRRQADIGDRLLGVIELTQSETEQARSPRLCAAAMNQVAAAAANVDLNNAAPPSRTGIYGVWLVLATVLVATAFLVARPAARNAWARMLAPWRSIPRYTFTWVQPIASTWIVPHGERSTRTIRLDDQSHWKPASATLSEGSSAIASSTRVGNRYAFELPATLDTTVMHLAIGDYKQSIELHPTLRPELTTVSATVRLPPYLQLPEPIEKDLRSGILSVVGGSEVSLHATASRSLSAASIDEVTTRVSDAVIASDPFTVGDEPVEKSIQWRDTLGLSGRQPFSLSIQSVADQPPSVVASKWPSDTVLLDSEPFHIEAIASDDFGVKRIGVVWQASDQQPNTPYLDERTIASGAPDASSLQVPVTFTAKSLGLPARAVELRLWAEDYRLDRERSYSVPYRLTILNPSQHAKWIAGRLLVWQQSALDVRDREMSLHQRNKELREQTREGAIDRALQDALREQAAAETANARRLSELTKAGKTLLSQAARNAEVGAESIQSMAEMIQTLQEISTQRMPTVADLLEKASRAMASDVQQQSDASLVGENRLKSNSEPTSLSPSELDKETKDSEFPSVVDQESSQRLRSPSSDGNVDLTTDESDSKNRLGLAATTVAISKASSDSGESEPSLLEEAIDEQNELLTEFKKLSKEMNATLVKLEGSTFVKRLKAASRIQESIANRLADRIEQLFGKDLHQNSTDREYLAMIGRLQTDLGEQLSTTIDDMRAFYKRKQMVLFGIVLDEMDREEVLPALDRLQSRITTEPGLSIAQADYWCHTLDRWADELVESPQGESDPGPKENASLPPSVILEVLRILEQEVNLRDETRTTEQAKSALQAIEYQTEAVRLGQTQTELRVRIESVVSELESIPDGALRYENDINLMLMVAQTMNEAASILQSPNTADEAIAAESEAIELLLRSKRVDPQGGGEAGSDPSGGGQGSGAEAALALLGLGVNENEQLRESETLQTTGKTGQVLPEEFRAGLEEYFRRVEESQ
ncbi:hypothetical protein [Novipirellula artificiosorum]|uniref:Uncharacterized protein n=1 Tax=Novipirellula artificiosorum TaxID=2528016 RepID=A0A5C6E0D7_9BACT|nr:hypothetical protein [Novipirellula artificiosorum]TWU42185.1 hypothetical protein Poly41_04810 [Novipirellula artificiosorum]